MNNTRLTIINTKKNANLIKLKKKVLFNKDLLANILSFSGPLFNEICQICSKPLCYSIFIININHKPIIHYNLEQCKKKIFCSEECLEEYKEVNSNKKCIISLLISILFFIIVFFVLVFILR